MNRARLLWLNALALVCAAAVLGAMSPSPRPACGAANACDATLFWEVGRRLARGDGAVYGSLLAVPGAPELPFGYPPTAFPLFVGWGCGPPSVTAALSGALGAAALGVAAARLGGLAFGVAAMAGGWMFFSAWLGQTGAWVGAAACGLAAALRSGRVVAAGALLAALLLKPQIGLFVAVALFFAGQRVVVAVAATVSVALAAISALIWGRSPWSGWLGVVLDGASGRGPALDRGYMSTWQALAPTSVETWPALGLAMGLVGMGLSAFAGRRAAAPVGVALVAGALFAPHGHPYDLAVWLPAAFFLGFSPRQVLALGLLAHGCVLAGVRAPLALASAWLLWRQLGSTSGAQRSG